MSRLPVIFLFGPTASGKTAIGMELYKRLDCQLISVDSSLVYRGMDIGTAKPTPEEQRSAPHALIDICDPWESYSAARFVTDAHREIERAKAASRVPVLLGGTMLYFNVLEKGLASMPAADESVRTALVQRAEAAGWEALHQELASIDPVSADKINPNDSQRIQRALEVWTLTGRPISEFQDQASQPKFTDTRLTPLIKIGLFPEDRALLHQRIEARLNVMLEAGFIAEVEQLLSHPQITGDLSSMRSVGYRQAVEYLSGESTEAEFGERARAATRQLAKRQLTWIRGMNEVTRYDSVALRAEFIVDEIQRMISEAS